MYIASKYEEMYPPALDEFSFITDNTYETEQIIYMEQLIMEVSLGLIMRVAKKKVKIMAVVRN